MVVPEVRTNDNEDTPSASFSSLQQGISNSNCVSNNIHNHLALPINTTRLSDCGESDDNRGTGILGSVCPMRSLSSGSGGLYISAPGKIILFGEHAVVYGRTAIAGSIDLRTYVSLFTSADGRIYLCLPEMNVEKTWMLKDLQKACERLTECSLEDGPPSLDLIVPIARKLSGACEDQCGVQHLAILSFWYLLIGVIQRKRAVDLAEATFNENVGDSIPSSPTRNTHSASSQLHQCHLQDTKTKSVSAWDLLAVKVTVRFKLPSCVGLGSSGAFCVCLAAALLQTAGLIPPPSVTVDFNGSLTWNEGHLEMIRKWSAAAESLIHGRASGLDAAVCTYGGVASYKPGKRIENLHNIPNLKVILVNSKVERNTSRMVQYVKDKLDKFPLVIDNIFNAIDEISNAAAKILQRSLIEENGGGILENGGCSTTVTPSFCGSANANCAPVDKTSNHLQPVSAGDQLSNLSSYVIEGKRGSTVNALSDFRTKLERNELTETFEKLNDLSRMNNQLLISLGVGHAKVEQICTLLGRYGIHPKMTGAGGGGSVFAFLKPDISQTILTMIRVELKKEGYEMWQPSLGGPGVMCHLQKPDLFSNVGPANSTTSLNSKSIGGVSTSRSNTPASLHQSTLANPRHKK